MAKPFVKWAGGKGWLLPTIEANLPADFNERRAVTYFEPFVGGGAMLFHMLKNHTNIKKAVINDINPALINCYKKIQNNHISLLHELKKISDEYYSYQQIDDKKAYYYQLRYEYNELDITQRNSIRAASLFIFFNKTCFNGLYRENFQGKFNVPYGKYVHPTICNERVIQEAHEALDGVKIMCGDFCNTMKAVDWADYHLFFLDPPYRPLLGENNFKQYTMNSFDDKEQESLKEFCKYINISGSHFILCNSNSEIVPGVGYFEQLYSEFNVHHIQAPRKINAYRPGVQMISEVFITNYEII